MQRVIIALSLALIPGTAIGQEERVKSPSEVSEAMLANLRGFKEELYPRMPATVQPPPFTPFTIWTTGRLSRPSPGGDSVSIVSLSHRVPKAAKKAYERGMKFANQGDALRAAEELEKAAALDPEYAAAHGDLGVEYIRMGRVTEAEAALRRAIALDPYVSVAHSNLGWVLFHLRNFPQAEKSARNALALSRNNDRAHLLLGLILSAAPETRAEGVRHIEQAVGTFPDVDRVLTELRGH